MMIDTFLQGLNQCGLWLEVRTSPEGAKKLVLSGNQTVINQKPGIRQYIKENREDLIDRLQNPVNTHLITGEGTSGLHFISCHLAQYGLCSNQMVEQDESTWRMSPDGLVFCLECWQSRNIEQAKQAVPYLSDHDQPTDLGTRIERIMDSPGYACCGGHDWRVDYDGILVCHHVIEGREAIEREQREQEKKSPVRKSAKANVA